MAVPYHVAATGIKSILENEFPGIDARHDKLHESLGYNGLVVGISPLRTLPTPSREIQQELYIFVQWYDKWDKEVNNEQAVDPFAITEMAHRFHVAIERDIKAMTDIGPEIWYYKVTGTEFPDDPTGNKSRFEATVLAYGDNLALTESIA